METFEMAAFSRKNMSAVSHLLRYAVLMVGKNEQWYMKAQTSSFKMSLGLLSYDYYVRNYNM